MQGAPQMESQRAGSADSASSCTDGGSAKPAPLRSRACGRGVERVQLLHRSMYLLDGRRRVRPPSSGKWLSSDTRIARHIASVLVAWTTRRPVAATILSACGGEDNKISRSARNVPLTPSNLPVSRKSPMRIRPSVETSLGKRKEEQAGNRGAVARLALFVITQRAGGS
jgi:hypothetical protein